MWNEIRMSVTNWKVSFLMKNYYVMGAAAKSVNPHLIDFQNCNIKHKTRSFKTTRRLDKSAALAESRLSASVKMRQTTGVTGKRLRSSAAPRLWCPTALWTTSVVGFCSVISHVKFREFYFAENQKLMLWDSVSKLLKVSKNVLKIPDSDSSHLAV